MLSLLSSGLISLETFAASNHNPEQARPKCFTESSERVKATGNLYEADAKDSDSQSNGPRFNADDRKAGSCDRWRPTPGSRGIAEKNRDQSQIGHKEKGRRELHNGKLLDL
jgi:hypothetical protein